MRTNLSQHAGQHSFSRARGHKDTAAGCARQLLRISQTGKLTRRHEKPPSIPLISYPHTHKPPCPLPPGVWEAAQRVQPAQARAGDKRERADHTPM